MVFLQMWDAYIFSSVLFYSAVFSEDTRIIHFCCTVACLVLLINSHYLHSPIHVPSTIIAFAIFALPFTATDLRQFFLNLFNAIAHAPPLVLEATVAFIFFGLFIKHAFYKPLRNAVDSRRLVAPIPIASLNHSLPKTARAQTTEQLRQNTTPDTTTPTTVKEETQPPTTPSTATAPSQHHQNHADQLQHQDEITPQPTARRPTKPQLRRRKQTKSQQLAYNILKQREEEQARMEQVRARQQALATANAEAAREARDARDAERHRLQDIVRDASESVQKVKKTLSEAAVNADLARVARRRAADQHSLSASGESEKDLDAACDRASRLEALETAALGDVNSAQARLTDVRDQLNRFRHY